MLEKIENVSEIVLEENNIIRYKLKTIILDDGVEIGASIIGHAVRPDDSDFTIHPPKIQDFISKIYTEEVLQEWQEYVASNLANV